MIAITKKKLEEMFIEKGQHYSTGYKLGEEWRLGYKDIIDVIDKLEEVHFTLGQDVRVIEWTTKEKDRFKYECGNCGYMADKRTNFCANCGAAFI